jgi:hypothetical protein
MTSILTELRSTVCSWKTFLVMSMPITHWLEQRQSPGLFASNWHLIDVPVLSLLA